MKLERGFANKKLETLSLKELKELQLDKLKKMVGFAYQNNEIYRNAYDKQGVKPDTIQELEDIFKLPILTKEKVVEHYPFGFLSVPERNIQKVFMSGGTTGKPITILYSLEDYKEVSDTASRIYPAAGLVPSSDGEKGNRIYHALPMGSHIIQCFIDGATSLGYTIIPSHFGPQEPGRHLEIIKDFEISALTIAPVGPKGSVNLQSLLEADEEGIIDEYINTIIYAGAPMPPEMIMDLKSAGKTVLSAYGSTEIGGIGYQSNKCKGVEPGSFHVFADRTLVEIVDENGNQLKPGQRGLLLVTSLGDDEFAGRATPIIRYLVGDEVTLIEGPNCECGRTPQYIVKPKRVLDIERMEKSCAGQW